MVSVRWLGHAAFIVKACKWVIAIDPWVTNPLSPYRSVDSFVKDYDSVDYIVVTHDHGDHVGDSVELLKRYREARLIAIYELAEGLAAKAGLHEKVIPANIGGPIDLEPNLKMVLTPALHSASSGSPCGVVITYNNITVYHAGDTAVFGDMSLIRELYSPHVAMLPIGGHFTMGIREALKAVELLRPKVVIPMHYNTFNLIRCNPEEFKGAVEARFADTKVLLLMPGEEVEV